AARLRTHLITESRQKSRIDCQFRDGHQELSTPCADSAELRNDLSFEIPWENEDVVRSGVEQALRRQNRNVSSGKVLPVLMGTTIHCEVQKVGPDSAEVEKSVSLARRSVSDDPLSRSLRTNKEFQKLAFGFVHSALEVRIVLEGVYAGFDLAVSKRFQARCGRLGTVLDVSSINTNRSAVSGKLLNVENGQAV